ncbi:peptidase S28 [Fistulina hepatica ATCC 64428]|uniref:Peptidase S28 n=1 Tax=Fistulina hepatica ATCC 64428 TaxID=1128425 RepID=A0A0D7ALS1_9AGAR|nr:peptidase S28 [Fistulina hepatica ATCC 64428]
MSLMLLQYLSFLVYYALSVYAVSNVHLLGAQGVNLYRLKSASAIVNPLSNSAQRPFAMNKADEFEEQWFTQPLDHFNNNSQTFLQRYWVNKRHYQPGVGRPVIVIDGGETSGEDRIPYLDTGIAEILARVTGGIGVVLEHRYYGASIPVQNLSTDSLRWLNNAQSAADSANFMANVKFQDIDEDLTAPGTPWIYYGGSYAGARAAHMRVLYPDLVYGAIASSAVTHADIINWEYMDVIRRYAPERCSSHLVNVITTIDAVLAHGGLPVRALKSLFGLGALEHDEDFVSVLEAPLGSWQAKCWDPEFGSNEFDEFCATLDKPRFGAGEVNSLDRPFNHMLRQVSVSDGLSFDLAIVNYAHYIRKHVVSQCPKKATIEECFGTYDDSKYRETTLDQNWRLWLFQVCTEWGYFTTAPPDPAIPRIISKLITLEYESKICRQAFPPGKYFVVPPLPNVTVVNELGDFDIAMDRLAIIDGEIDPWRPVTPHSDYAEDRLDTVLRPFKLIPNGVHHYDEWGLLNMGDEPPEIRKIHGEIIAFVMEWLKDWKSPFEPDPR